MTCDRCQGLILDEYGDVRCVNCGHRVIERTVLVRSAKDWDRRTVWTPALRRHLRRKRLAWNRRQRKVA